MLLEGKVAVIYGGGGSIGGAVSTAFAQEGATVHLAGRTRSGWRRWSAGSGRQAAGRTRPGWMPWTRRPSTSTPLASSRPRAGSTSSSRGLKGWRSSG